MARIQHGSKEWSCHRGRADQFQGCVKNDQECNWGGRITRLVIHAIWLTFDPQAGHEQAGAQLARRLVPLTGRSRGARRIIRLPADTARQLGDPRVSEKTKQIQQFRAGSPVLIAVIEFSRPLLRLVKLADPI